MFDAMQLEGPFARFTLRSWTVELGADAADAERVRCHDAHEALTLLRGLVEGPSLARLASFVYGQFLMDQVGQRLADHPHDLLWFVARRIVSGELVLTRERIEPRSSELPELSEQAVFEPSVNEIDEGVGLQAQALAELRQAQQAQALRLASALGVPFCEVCTCAS
ncbi:MAG TPA: hypothetical protein VK034_00120 [Enhygromyxa sp.]|nr:hypothetical protein [Enhygromyxa sp.]